MHCADTQLPIRLASFLFVALVVACGGDEGDGESQGPKADGAMVVSLASAAGCNLPMHSERSGLP